MNQKGIAFIPIIIWSIVISGSIFIAQDAVKHGYITIDSPYISKETPTPQPTTFPTPLPTYKPSPTPTPKPPQGQVKGITQTDQNSKQTQGRTGRIIKYKEYCKGGQEISVYENELITRKALSDGKTYSMTKDDWDCYERQVNKPKETIPNNQPPSNQVSTIKCYDPLTKQTYQVSKETCDKWVQEYNQIPAYTPPQYFSCTICYPYSPESCLTYNYLYKTKEECDAEQQKVNQLYGSSTTPQPTPTPDNSYNQQQNSQCKMYADQWYTNQGTQCGGSCSEAIKQIRYPEYQQKLKECDQLYPI